MNDYLTRATEILRRVQSQCPTSPVARALVLIDQPNPRASDRMDAAREISGASVAAAALGKNELRLTLRSAQRLIQLSSSKQAERVRDRMAAELALH